MLKDIPANKNVLVFCVCLIQGLLQSRQNLTCGSQQKWLPWGVSCISQCLNEIIQYNSTEFTQLANIFVEVIFIHSEINSISKII